MTTASPTNFVGALRPDDHAHVRNFADAVSAIAEPAPGNAVSLCAMAHGRASLPLGTFTRLVRATGLKIASGPTRVRHIALSANAAAYRR